LNNFLEALKRGDGVAATLKRYRSIGLLKPDLEPATKEPSSSGGSATKAKEDPELAFQGAFARFCQRLHRGLNQAATKIVAISANAVNAIPKLVDVEVGLTLCAGIPAPTFTFKKKKSLSLSDLCDILAGIADT